MKIEDMLSAEVLDRLAPLYGLVLHSQMFLAAMDQAELVRALEEMSPATYRADDDATRDLYDKLRPMLELLGIEFDRRDRLTRPHVVVSLDDATGLYQVSRATDLEKAEALYVRDIGKGIPRA